MLAEPIQLTIGGSVFDLRRISYGDNSGLPSIFATTDGSLTIDIVTVKRGNVMRYEVMLRSASNWGPGGPVVDGFGVIIEHDQFTEDIDAVAASLRAALDTWLTPTIVGRIARGED